MRALMTLSTIIFVFIISFNFSPKSYSDESANIITLRDAISKALDNNKEIQAARNELDAAKAAVRKAKGRYLFNLSMTGEISQLDTFPEESLPLEMQQMFGGMDFGPSEDVSKSLSFSLVQPISTFGLIPSSIRAAESQRNVKEQELRLKEQEIALSVIETFYGVWLSQTAVEIRVNEVERARLAYDYAKKKFDVGQSPKFDMIRAEVDVAQAEENLVSAKKQSETALLAFQRLLGTDENLIPEMSDVIAIDDFDMEMEICLETALRERPELIQLKNGIEAQNAVISLNRLRPSLNFIANAKYSDTSSTFSGKNSFMWLVQLTVPIFDGMTSKNGVDEARANRDAVENRYNDLRDLIRMEIKTNYLALKESQARVESSTKILAQAREALRMAELGYNEGVVTYLDLVSARNMSTSAELNNLKALTDFHVAYSRLEKSMGRMPTIGGI